MTLRFERKLPLILFFVFLVLTTIGILFYENTVSTKQTLEWEKQTYELTSTLDETLHALLDADAGVSAYVITYDESYLDKLTSGRKTIHRNLARVRTLSNGNGPEISRLAKLINAQFTRLDQKVALRKSQGFQVAVLELGKSADLANLTNIRETSESLKGTATVQLRVREQALDRALSRTIFILIISSIAGIISLGFINYVVFRETSKRSDAENALRNVNRDLESRIDERTTELKRANNELRLAGGEREELLAKEQGARREAEIANRQRDEFMATVSHELRTPLNSMLGWARLLKGGLLSDDQHARAVNTIIKNSEVQNRLIEDLLDVARIVSGKLDLEFTEFEISKMLAGTIDTMKPAADAKQITIDFFPWPNTGDVFLYGDKNRIQQVILNLLTNAVKFSPEGSHIEVITELEAAEVAISVIDHGIGIKPEFLPIVFERFRQDPGTSARTGGLGLGLAIVRNLVEMHRGSVTVESEGENLGTVFTVRLPVKTAVSDESIAAAQ